MREKYTADETRTSVQAGPPGSRMRPAHGRVSGLCVRAGEALPARGGRAAARGQMARENRRSTPPTRLEEVEHADPAACDPHERETCQHARRGPCTPRVRGRGVFRGRVAGGGWAAGALT